MALHKRALWFGTLAFTINFSIWALYASIGVNLSKQLDISTVEFGFLLASPVISGVIFNVLAGIFSQRYNSKTCFTLQMLATIPALLILPHANTLTDYIMIGAWLGLSGSAFTFGASYVHQFSEQRNMGLRMGIFGAASLGAALTLEASSHFVSAWGMKNIGYGCTAVLILMTFVFAVFAPKPPLRSAVPRPIKALLGRLQIWRFGLYYFFVFGSFLALLLWLPNYYLSAYELSHKQALAFTLVFVASSSMGSISGGWLADRYGGRRINWSVFWVCLVCLFFLSYPPTTMTIHGIDNDVNINIEIGLWPFSALLWLVAAALGLGRASMFKLMNDYYSNEFAHATGLIVAAGALGGAVLSIGFGLAENILGIHSASFMLLYGLLAICMITMHIANKSDRQQQRLQQAVDNNFLEFD